jgi:hypothetical protein
MADRGTADAPAAGDRAGGRVVARIYPHRGSGQIGWARTAFDENAHKGCAGC